MRCVATFGAVLMSGAHARCCGAADPEERWRSDGVLRVWASEIVVEAVVVGARLSVCLSLLLKLLSLVRI